MLIIVPKIITGLLTLLWDYRVEFSKSELETDRVLSKLGAEPVIDAQRKLDKDNDLSDYKPPAPIDTPRNKKRG